MKDTSLAMYDALCDQGLLNELCLRVYQFIESHQDSPEFGGVISQADASRALDTNIGRTWSCIQPRFVDLMNYGVIREDGRKCDVVTGHSVIGYRTTGRLAIAPQKKSVRTYKQLLLDCLQFDLPDALRRDIELKLRITGLAHELTQMAAA